MSNRDDFSPSVKRTLAERVARGEVMKVVIYGRDNCSYCKRAVELAKQLKGHGYGDYEYIDITTAGIDKEKLSEIVGKPVETIPQVLIDGQPIGGYTELAAYINLL